MLAEWERLDWRGKLDLLRRSSSAFWDALLLQQKRLEDEMFQDLRYGARMLLKDKGLTIVAVLTLALGIGANTAIFSVVKGVLLRPLPYPEPQQLVRLFETVERTTMASDRMEVAPANFLDWQAQTRSFSGLAAYGVTGSVIGGDGEAERLEGAMVTADFFATLGVAPLQGRAFTVDDERAAERLVIIGFELRQRRFGGAENIIGQNIQLDGFTFTVIGVTPPGFDYPRRTQIYELYRLNANQRRMREAHFLKAIARLKPGVSVSQAQAEMSNVARQLAEQYPQTNKNWSARVIPLLDEEVGRVKPALLALLGAVGLVLLIACANVASLLLARAVSRQAEIGVRMALGAGRWRIVRQLLTESMLLAGLGGVTGLVVGELALNLLLGLAPGNLPRLENVRLDAGVLVFTLLLTLATGVAFGLAPAWSVARQDLNSSLKSSGGRISGRSRLFNALVAAEIALTLVVLIGAGLLINSFLRLQRVEPGLDVDRLLTVTFEPPSARYNGSDWKAQRLSYSNQLLARVARLPGVEAVGSIDSLPLSGEGRVYRFRKSDEPDTNSSPAATFQVVTPDYFRAVGVRLLRGRRLADSDLEDTPPVVVINETMARRFWPTEEALGKRIFIRNDERPAEIVGVVSDVKHFSLERATAPEMYRPFNQLVIDVMPMVIRANGNPADLAKAVRRQAVAVDPAVAVDRIAPMSELLSDSLAQRRFVMLLLSVFAGMALLLAVIGVYGVMAYNVTERTREIGLRMALGAPSRAILWLVLRQGMTLALAGLALGLLISLPAARLLADLLFEVSSTDWLTFVAIGFLLMVVTLLACSIPARRAVKVDPLAALRHE